MRPVQLLAAVFLAAPALALGARQPAPKKDVGSRLQAQAKISMDSARVVALARVPGGAVKDGELEREHGRLVYSFDITVPGKPGVEEVQVSARDARVVSQAHESPKQEAAEARADARAAKRAAKAGTGGTATP